MFKMGKFYELFEMDAHVGATDLGLAYMKGEQPPAASRRRTTPPTPSGWRARGHRVVVVEQVETPAQLGSRARGGR